MFRAKCTKVFRSDVGAQYGLVHYGHETLAEKKSKSAGASASYTGHQHWCSQGASWSGLFCHSRCSIQCTNILANIRGHLTCTNKRAQADEQKIARNERLLAPPAMHLLFMCSKLVPSEFPICENGPRKKVHFCAFPGICCISESAKTL